MKVGILGKLTKVKTTETIDALFAFLQKLGYEPTVFTKPSEIDGVDVVIVLGGDGAMLHAAVPAARKNIKVIGINYGNLGFLTEYEKDEWERVQELLQRLEKNECSIVKRSILQLELGDKVYYALNEFALQRDYGICSVSSTQILKLQVRVKDGEDCIAGDGVLFCTPTGSTAYSLSAGGAILTPEVPVVMMTPICAFSMRARPIVFSDQELFTVKNLKGRAIVLSDGKVVATLEEGAEIRIRKAPFTADFPVKEHTDFFARVRKKLND